MKVVAIIQARMSSTRLPGKVLAEICGQPMLKWLLNRIMSVQEIDEVVVATTTNPADDELQVWLNTEGVLCFRGSENDVLDRYYWCAKERCADVIVRVTADDPLKDPGLIRQAITSLINDPKVDYCSNTLHPTYPEGLDIEVFRFTALEHAYREAMLASEREHVTPYIWKNPQLFFIKQFQWDRNLSGWRWTVDKPADLDLMKNIFSHFCDRPLVPFIEIVEFLEKNPALLLINSGTVRNEGYLKSLTFENYE